MNKIYKIMPLDLLIILIWIIMTIIFVITPSLNDSFIKTVLGIPMVLFIPGYILTSVLFIGIDDVETTRRIALSFGLSIAIIPLLGLLLNFTFGLTLIPVLAILCIYDILFIFVAKYRREKLPEKERFSVRFFELIQIIGDGLKPKGIIDIILTTMLIFTTISAIGIAYYVVAIPKIGERFTEFYVLDANGKANNYSTYVKVGSSSDMTVYISNYEYESMNYTLQIDIDKNILVYRQLTLDNNETWKQNITFSPEIDGADKRLEFLLFKEGDLVNPYRELYLTVNVYK